MMGNIDIILGTGKVARICREVFMKKGADE